MSLTCQPELSTFIYTVSFSSHNSPERQAIFPPKSPGLTARKGPVQHWNLKPLTLYHSSPCSVAVPSSPPSLSRLSFLWRHRVFWSLAWPFHTWPVLMTLCPRSCLAPSLCSCQRLSAHSHTLKNCRLLPRGLTLCLFPVWFVASSVRAFERSDIFDASISKAQQFSVLPDTVLFVLLYTALLEEIIALFTS